MKDAFRYFDSSPKVIRLVVRMFVRYKLSLRTVENLLAERGIDICHQTVRLGWHRHYSWRAVDREGDVLVTDDLRSYRTALDEIGNAGWQEIDCWANNRAENSHLPFRRRERAMLRFRSLTSVRKFNSVYAAFHNHFNQDRRLIGRRACKVRHSAAQAEWRSLAG